MDSLSTPVTLLVLTSRPEEAERITTELRDGGLAVHGVRSDDPDRLEELVATHNLELILCCAYDPGIDLDTCMRRYREIDIDLPLVVIADGGTDSSRLISAMRSGARDLTEQGDREHLQLVVARELADLRERRSVRELQQRLEECERRARQAMDSSSEAAAYVQEGVHLQPNPTYCELFGFDDEADLDGYPLLDLVAADSQEACRRFMRSFNRLGDGESAAIEIDFVRADTGRFHAEMVLTKSSLDGEPCIRAVVRNPQPIDDTPTPGLLDGETGLPNRAAVLQELERRLTGSGSGDRLGAIYVGVDAFSTLKTREGLTEGLEAMAVFGKRLRRLAPEGAYVGRVCDDGFLVLTDDLDELALTGLAAKVRTEARIPRPASTPSEGRADCATGAVLAEAAAIDAAGLLDAAYGKSLLSPSTGAAASRAGSGGAEAAQDLAARVSNALSGEGLRLVYQPIISLKGDSQENYSVFVRLPDDDERLRRAWEFLPAAVRAGEMVDIDRWVIEHAIGEVARQREQNRKVSFFISIAEQTLLEEQLLIWICDQLRGAKARGNWLTFQILEDDALSHSEAVIKLAEGLRKVRCRVALNRFAASPDPKPVLASLPTDFVKLAPELAAGLADDEAKQNELVQLVAAAQEAGVKTIATGVEEARTLSVLWTAGVDYVQGNFLQKPATTIETE
jgi:EAL domain-containing protein (putative c-di-GMP-specific phosphodiesterase class I)/GGDEF domain-containing protein/PAS domain-containing protein